MFHTPPIGRVSPANRGPIHTAFDALGMAWLLLDPSVRHQTLVLALDDERRGLAALMVNDTDDPESFLGVVDSVTEAAVTHPQMASLVIVTVRPSGGFDVDDLARWHEADATCDESGLELIEWFVVGHSISSPRHLCGVDERWEQ